MGGHTTEPAFVADCDDGTTVTVCADCLGAYLGLDYAGRRDFQRHLSDRLLACRGRTRWVVGAVDAVLAEHNTAHAQNLMFELQHRFADTLPREDDAEESRSPEYGGLVNDPKM